LREAGAISRAGAKPRPDLSRSQQRRFDQLLEHGVIRRAGEHRYFLDEHALADLRGRQLAITFGVIVAMVGAAAAWFLIGTTS
jgi:hypothetical protein